MNKRSITIWISCIMIIVGIIMVIIGASLGASFGYLDNYDTESFTRDYAQKINTVDIEYNIGKIIIKKGDQLKIVADEVRKGSVKTDVSGDKLIIETSEDNFPFYYSKKSELTVYIPDNISYFSVRTGIGELKISDITADEVVIKTGVGEAYINNLTSKKTSIKSGVGEFNINNSNLSNIDLKSGVGEVDINAKIDGDCKINGGIGDIKLNLSNSIDDYRFDFSNGIGNISVNGSSYKHYKNHDGEYCMTVKNGIGDIEIDME